MRQASLFELSGQFVRLGKEVEEIIRDVKEKFESDSHEVNFSKSLKEIDPEIVWAGKWLTKRSQASKEKAAEIGWAIWDVEWINGGKKWYKEGIE